VVLLTSIFTFFIFDTGHGMCFSGVKSPLRPILMRYGQILLLSAVVLMAHLLLYVKGSLFCWSDFAEMTVHLFWLG
jgi:hypothetical protein